MFSTAPRPLAPSSRRLLRPALAALALGTLLLGATAVPAQADAAGRPFQPSHPERDFAGSTVVAHEGRGPSGPLQPQVTQTPGLDVSSYQGSVNWSAAAGAGARFAYVKATEGTGYTNPDFTQQYNGSYNTGLIRGAYHFALPNASSGATQANYFVSHGGGWSADGKTLPPALDIEYNPYGATCYGLSQAAMVSWIHDFSNTVHTRTGRYPTIYTTNDWWSTCTGDNAGFGTTSPLWIARYSSSPGTLPNGWSYQTFWQYADSGTFPGDQDYFNGAYTQVQALAKG
ncbi:GH25 family lysozyme M1 (1,4-beta-N-acetylmuramidase) [Kitasatospora sp. MAA4]|uniref:lysozyme n=1 Tax=Kitasatospora sp. MAA4 TaxID=3035093 RepID=UPI0024749ABB|nr:lysozyme [Kitasatospora sp. MAA4]MDH6132038.1 GH25 family lysozyme M1 (1,4-beta-N-acetylmuramidase) [Kitasatospora sp. MAA4]